MERHNVARWRYHSLRGPQQDIYHPLNALGIYGQTYQREKFCRMIKENAVPIETARILDLGSGRGDWCRFFAELKGTTAGIVGVDCSDDAIAYARGISPIQYERHDMVDLGFVDIGSVDFVSAFVSFMFLRDEVELQATLREAYRVLANDGHLFVSEMEGRHDANADYSGWPMREMIRHARESGFELIARRSLFKSFFWKYNSYERVRYSTMDWLRAVEHLVPGRYKYYFLLFRKTNGTAEDRPTR